MLKWYCMLMNGKDTRIVGPFDTLNTLSKYGRKWQADNGDNPNWQSVELPDGHPFVALANVPFPESDDAGGGSTLDLMRKASADLDDAIIAWRNKASASQVKEHVNMARNTLFDALGRLNAHIGD